MPTPSSCPSPASRAYWRRLGEGSEGLAFVDPRDEFPPGASEWTDPVSRRRFMKLMSASCLLAGFGLTGCRRPEETILPFVRRTEAYAHGVPQYFATARPVGDSAIPLVVKTHEGRPVKLEGNAEHPIHRGASGPPTAPARAGTDWHAQASILDLYDPDRSRRFTRGEEPTSRESAFELLAQTARDAEASQGRGLAFLLGRSSSPTRARLQKLLSQQYPHARWCVYEPAAADGQRAALALAYGQAVRPFHRLAQARRLLSFDSDFLGGEEDPYRLLRDFARGRRLRRPDDPLNRLYVVESLLTLTGGQAEHRLRLPPSQIPTVAALCLAELIAQTRTAEPALTDLGLALRQRASGSAVDPRWVRACVEDLWAHRSQALVLAGHRQPMAVHLVAEAMNELLGAAGSTVEYHAWLEPPAESLPELARRLNAGEVRTLIILGGNPVYDAPADLDWARVQGRAQTVIRLGSHEDETSALSHWRLPAAHYLESWGDARTADGVVVPVQPLITPLFGGLTEIEVLARLGGLPDPNPYALVRATLATLYPEGPFEEHWKRFLHDGFLAGSASPPVAVRYDWKAAGPGMLAAERIEPPGLSSLEVVFQRDYALDDGRYANNAWLQEWPDPVTKITWDNVVLLSPRTAQELGLQRPAAGDQASAAPVVRVELGGAAVEGPAWVQPGLADYVIGLALGYGRTAVGRVGQGVGFNVYPLRTTQSLHFGCGAKVHVTNQSHLVACTQDHWSLEGRPIIRETDLASYRRDPRFAQVEEPSGTPPLYANPLDEPNAQGVSPKQAAAHWWGMAIDLNACVGCSACVLACQSENNIPVVGKEQIRRHREMHWLRLERYYAGAAADPQVVHQPMMCLHCEAAPCESVCPVNATVHDQEGLNLMVYSRCVGTRYCSNNCPYKVRRFNFFDYNRRPLDQLYRSPLVSAPSGEWELKRWFLDPDRGTRPPEEWELMKLARNPEVTVRMRGVMEKCTYCVQRLEQAKVAAKAQAGPAPPLAIPEGALQTACQQACPAEAIVFGNLRDPASQVAQAQQQDRAYRALAFLGTRPRTTYLARVRNPNPAMPLPSPDPPPARGPA